MCKKVITSEFVSYGHPDKIADTIADSLLDAYLEQDKNTRAGIEVMVKDNNVVLGGEVSSNAIINYDTIVRDIFKGLDFPPNHNLNPENIKIINLIGKQSSEIHQGVDKSENVIGAGVLFAVRSTGRRRLYRRRGPDAHGPVSGPDGGASYALGILLQFISNDLVRSELAEGIVLPVCLLQPVERISAGSGQSVVTTLDEPIQRACEGIAVSRMQRGCILVLECATAQVLASVSVPQYDPQNIAASIAAADTSLIDRASAHLHGTQSAIYGLRRSETADSGIRKREEGGSPAKE